MTFGKSLNAIPSDALDCTTKSVLMKSLWLRSEVRKERKLGQINRVPRRSNVQRSCYFLYRRVPFSQVESPLNVIQTKRTKPKMLRLEKTDFAA